jgi:exopolyphosphatase / guanosine-5'-triphosphate,3'-diphosphate pyrophosphatase
MKRASIDIGSNTTLLLIGEIEDGKLNELENESRVTGLGRELDKNKAFLEVAMEDTFSALSEYGVLIDKAGLERSEVIMTATEASRVARNSQSFYKKVKDELGLNVTIISSEGEAFYTAFGVIAGSESQSDNLIIMDIGGASTEFIKVKDNPFSVVDSISLPFGSVRATDWINEGIFEEKMLSIINSSRLNEFKTEHLFCVAGSMTSLGGMIKGLKEFDPSEVNGTQVEFSQFLTFKEKINSATADQLVSEFPFLGKRAKSIVGGARLGEMVGKVLGIKTFEISTLGLRYGTLFAGEIDERYRIK